MFTFFQGQMDYVYFLYGFSFFLLGLVSLLVKNNTKTAVVWKWLGAFGLLHGIGDWLYLVGVAGDIHGLWINSLKTFFLMSSFFCLFEFARRFINKNKKINFGIWVYIIVFFATLIGGYFFGQIGIEMMLGFILGIAGAVGAGFGFKYNHFAIGKNKNFFSLGALALWLYAVTLLINPAGQVFGIPITDQNTFFKTFGVPIYLFREVFILILVYSVWSYHQSSINNEFNSQQIEKKVKIGRQLSVALLVLSVVGWFFVNLLDNLSRTEITDDSQTISTILTNNVGEVFNKGVDFSRILAGSLCVVNMLEDPNLQNIQAANITVDHYKKASNIDLVYIMDKSGKVLASSNRDEANSLIGNNFSLRPYFVEAINGRPGTLFATGILTKKAGFFSSHPIVNNKNKVIGVAVVKINLSDLEDDFKKFRTMFLVSPEGVVFLSGDNKYRLKSFQTLSLEERRNLLKTQLYGKGDFETVFDNRPKNNDILKFNNQPHLVNVFPIIGGGWELFVAHPIKIINYYRLFGICLTFIFSFIIVFFFIIVQNVRRNSALAYFASIVFSSDDVIIGADLSGKIISWNKGVEKIYGYSKSEIIGKNITILFADSCLINCQKNIDKIQSGNFIEHFEALNKNKEGKVFSVSLTFSPIKDDLGEVVGVSITARDISKEKEAEEILVNHMLELEKFKLASDSSSDAITITDNDANILYANVATEKMSGFSMKEIINNKIENLWGGNMDINFYEKLWYTIKKEKKTFIGEIKNRRKNGEEYYVNARLYPLLDKDKNVQFFVGVETDITKAKEIDRVKSEFVSITSHQLRTPLTGIRWFSELLLKGMAGKLKPDQVEYIKQVADSNERMIRLVDDLLDVSHINEAGKFNIILEKQDFSTVILETVRDQENEAKIKNITIKLSKDCLKKTLLGIDHIKMLQAIQNILNNAIKYSPNNTTISIDCQIKNRKFICSISDHGIGIPSHQQHRVFEKFFRADNVISVGSGTGLGLYIANYIVLGHGGKLWFESKEGEGTTFFISLPIK